MKTKHKVMSFIAFLAVVIVFINTDTFALLMAGDFDALLTSDAIWELSLITLLLMIVQNLFTVVPLVVVITINVAIYGFIHGYIWSLATSVIGALICFFAVRFWFQDLLLKRINATMADKLERNAFFFVFIARIFPFVPTSLINIASGVSTMKAKHYFVSTLFGNLIYILVLSLVSQGLLLIDWEYYVYVGIAVLFIVVFIVYKKIKKKRTTPFTLDK